MKSLDYIMLIGTLVFILGACSPEPGSFEKVPLAEAINASNFIHTDAANTCVAVFGGSS